MRSRGNLQHVHMHIDKIGILPIALDIYIYIRHSTYAADTCMHTIIIISLAAYIARIAHIIKNHAGYIARVYR